jgi:hypothetical protein
MRHPTDGTLRRLLDEPAGVADADREHVAGCPVCLAGLAAAERDAAPIGAALDVEVTTDVDAAWHRLSSAVAVERPRRASAAAPGRRWRNALRSPVVAVVGAVALVAGATAAAAADWLPIFHAEQVAPVTAPEADLIKLPELDALGEMKVTEEIDIRAVADAAAAEKATGLAVPRVGDLPRGVTGGPAYFAAGRASAELTFSVEKAAQATGTTADALPPPPPGLDGAKFRLTAGPGLAAVWAEDRPAPAMVVVRAIAPAAYSSGIPFETARDYVLSLPGVPESVASQLRGFSGDGTTLPLFVSSDEQTTTTADVGGHPATVLTSRDRTMAGVVWVDGGVLTAVAGSLSTDEVLSVARGLRWDR